MDFCFISNTVPQPFLNQATVEAQYGDRTLTVTSNQVTTQYVQVEAAKTVTPLQAQVGEQVHYTISITNRSSLPITQVKVTDQRTAGQVEISNVRVNGGLVPGADLALGIVLPGIGAGGTAVITFDALILEGAPDILENVAVVDYDYAVDGQINRGIVQSNTATLTVVRPQLQVEKGADRSVVTAEEPTITYWVSVTNPGSVTLDNVVITDPLPQGMGYVPGTTVINGDNPVDLDPAAGIPVGSLAPGQSVWVAFQASAQF